MSRAVFKSPILGAATVAPKTRAVAQPRRLPSQVPTLRQLRPAARQTRAKQGLSVRALGPGPGSGLSPELKSALDEYVSKYKIVVFMKGTPQFPQCGFSNTVCQIMTSLGAQFQGVNILEDDSLRMGLKEYSSWPTFPQVYIDGEFFGGCDIMIEEFQNGNLKETIERVMME